MMHDGIFHIPSPPAPPSASPQYQYHQQQPHSQPPHLPTKPSATSATTTTTGALQLPTVANTNVSIAATNTNNSNPNAPTAATLGTSPPPPPSPSAFHRLYSIQEHLGKGSYANVYRCLKTKTRESFAVKVVEKEKATPSQLNDLAREIEILRSVRHPFVIAVFDVFDVQTRMYIVMELLRGGDLFHVITRLMTYSEHVAALLLRNCLLALEYLHGQGIVHRDIKPDNILLINPIPATKIDLKNRPNILTEIKLADFGFAEYCRGPSETCLTKCCGTPYYIAPEILNCGLYKTGPPYGRQVDLWSLGVVTCMLLTGAPPFHAEKRNQLFRLIVKGNINFALPVWQKLSPGAIDFIQRLLTTDPRARLTATQALQHKWIEKAVENSQLHLPAVQSNLRTFNARRKLRAAVFGVEAAHRLVYIEKCKSLGIRPNSGLLSQMEERAEAESHEIDMTANYAGGRKGLTAVMELVKAKRKLKKLVLRNNEIENTSVDTIVSTLARHPSITHIDLSHNPLSRTAARKLIELVQRNPNIQKVELEGTLIHAHKIQTIEELLRRNRSGGAIGGAFASTGGSVSSSQYTTTAGHSTTTTTTTTTSTPGIPSASSASSASSRSPPPPPSSSSSPSPLPPAPPGSSPSLSPFVSPPLPLPALAALPIPIPSQPVVSKALGVGTESGGGTASARGAIASGQQQSSLPGASTAVAAKPPSGR